MNVFAKVTTAINKVWFKFQMKKIAGFPVIVHHKSAAFLTMASVDKKTDVRNIRLLGGCFASHVTREMLTKAYKEGHIAKWAYLLSIGVPDFYQVILCKEAMDGLTKDEVKAIVGHEVGHIVRGHLHGNKPMMGNVILDAETEFEADDHGVVATSKEVMRSALMKLIENQVNYLFDNGEDELAVKILQEIVDDGSIIGQRLERLL